MKCIITLLLTLVYGLSWAKEPALTAKSWIVTDGNGTVLDSRDADTVRPVASITKLMTVIIVLRSGASLTEILPVKLYNRPMTRQQLIDYAMIRSDNAAADLLCSTYPGGHHRCIIEMNHEAQRLHMVNTLFVEPTGLSQSNVSTASDLLKLVGEAAKYPAIVAASNRDTVELPGKKPVLAHNTNPIVGHGIEFLVSKTGWIRASGGCIVMMLNTVNGWRTVVLLGSASTKTRIPEAKYLAEQY